MTPPVPRGRRRAALRRTVTGGVLVAVGLLLWLGYGLLARTETHSYTGHRPPPRYVTLSAGARYVLGTPGGRPALVRAGVRPDSLRCTATGSGGGGAVALTLSVEPDGTKATTQIASFRAPFGGRAHVACAGVARVYVDNATGDPSGLFLVAAMAVLAVGLPVLLSGVRGLLAARQRVAGSTQPPNARSSS